jgi:hypothetical protein
MPLVGENLLNPALKGSKIGRARFTSVYVIGQYALPLLGPTAADPFFETWEPFLA